MLGKYTIISTIPLIKLSECQVFGKLFQRPKEIKKRYLILKSGIIRHSRGFAQFTRDVSSAF